ncbi:hypothetical protein IFM89_010644 [Coptis chinensis]|uniref:protein-serine/threonine phosphatase n=1 Tax=Coptis chinensis TaxID=261450 RepID=A0A835INV1_9MAGN|nr:hypothetical protein IFM89_010644 [Coptis chinensis]
MLVVLMKKLLSLCWKPFKKNGGNSNGGGGGREGLLWFRDIGSCSCGEFSISVIQANQVLEDQCQIESDSFGSFVGVYDGHGGPDTARYIVDNLFRNFKEILSETQVVTSDTIRRAFLQTEAGFTDRVTQLFSTRPQIATVGSCCLVGVVSQKTIFIANLGDSRVVLGRRVGKTKEIEAIQLSREHNANLEAVRQELREQHPHDPQIVALKHGVWRVKGIIQVSRSLGDLYMKHAKFNKDPINAKFRVPEPMNMPIMSANPAIVSLPIQPNDCFLIFASDGLWEHLSNETAVDIVQKHPHVGSAKRLIKAALQEAARKREMRYADLRRIDKKVRRHFHDDISVIVLFLNHDLISQGLVQGPPLSVRSALEYG